MAKATTGLTKRALISKANKRTVVITSIAAFVFVFSVVASNSLIKQMAYQNRVIGARKDALKVAEDSLVATKDLETAYRVFVSTPKNIIGGNPTGNGDRDGDNAKIILDALPSNYDYPALATSIEKIVTDHGLRFVSITGNDDAIAQQENTSSAAPQPIEMPIEFSVTGGYEESREFIKSLERSIRPFQVTSTEIMASSTDGGVTIKIAAKTYFQPAKNLNVIEEVVR